MYNVGEAEILDASRAGRVLVCEDGTGLARIDADTVRQICGELVDQVDPRGVRLRKAAVTGILNLTGMDVPFPLSFEDCEFESPVILEGAQLYGMVLAGCPLLPGLLANGVKVRHDLDLSAGGAGDQAAGLDDQRGDLTGSS